MNREFKFRIWNHEANGWDHPNFLQDWDDNNGITFKCLPEGNYVIQQYTGLKDKNDKEIYEGDIVEGYLSVDRIGAGGCVESNEWTFKGVVEFEGCGFYCSEADFPLDQYEFLEVIGNIFENPEIIG